LKQKAETLKEFSPAKKQKIFLPSQKRRVGGGGGGGEENHNSVIII
jgi:hypothetical protein